MMPLDSQLKTIIDAIPILAWSMRPDGSIDYFNQQWTEYTGMPIEQALNWGWKDAKHPDDLVRISKVFERATETGQAVEVEGRIRRRDGVYRWFLIRANPLRDETGAIVRWYGTDADIEDRKQAEEEIKRFKDRLQDENVVLKEQIDRTQMFEEIVGESRALKVAASAVARVAPTDSTVLLLGETGTGKELFARAIHKSSLRSERPFVSLNCAAIPDSLVASELFGHEKGAFTGAIQRRLGRFELADGGTLFLDEVGDLPLETQVALLRVLQEREFERVGGVRPIKADVRVIAATNRDLSKAVSEGSFRRDLFYRLNVVPIGIPTWRDRKDDIPLLVHYFVDRYGRKVGKKIAEIDGTSMDLLRDYCWPGNIRELQNIIERAVIVSDSSILTIDENWFSQPLHAPETNNQFEPFQKISADAQKSIIETALRESAGRVYGPTGAARRLGVPRSTLESKIRTLRIDKNRFRSEAFATQGD
jgi:PAS domain S-box-containing protein